MAFLKKMCRTRCRICAHAHCCGWSLLYWLRTSRRRRNSNRILESDFLNTINSSLVKTIKKYQAIIFDIDGTLCDSAQLCTSAWNKVLKDNGYENQILIADFKSNLEKPFPEIIQNIIPSPFNEEENIADLLNIAEIKTIEENGWNLYSGVYETIQELSNLYNIALISNCQSDYLNMFLHLSGLQEFIADKDCWGFSNCTKTK